MKERSIQELAAEYAQLKKNLFHGEDFSRLKQLFMQKNSIKRCSIELEIFILMTQFKKLSKFREWFLVVNHRNSDGMSGYQSKISKGN
jgi:hypothetical protein